MRIKLPSTFNTRIFLPLTSGLLMMVAGFAVVQILSVKETRQQVQEERLVLAEVVAERVDAMLRDMRDYFQLMVRESDLDPSHFSEENQAELEAVYNNFSGLVDFVMITDATGTVTGNYPFDQDGTGYNLSSDEYIQRILEGEECLFTNLYPTPANITPCSWIKMSVKNDDDEMIGVIFARLNLSDPRFADLMQPVGIGETGFGDLVDANGMVLTSGRPGRTLLSSDCMGLFSQLVDESSSYVGEYPACQDEDDEQLLAFAPIEEATWGVAIHQSKDEAFAYSRAVGGRSMLVGALAGSISLFLLFLVDRGMIKPMKALSVALEEIKMGDLDHPLPMTDNQEIDTCVECFESLRKQLKVSVEKIELMNLDLENKVALRTSELQEAEQTVKRLLHRIVVAQEEERKRIARELHDETSQSLTALNVMLNTVVLAPAATPEDVKAQLGPIQDAATAILDEINRIILDLRPGILDDLGLVQAIDWYAKTRFGEAGIGVNVWTVGNEQRAPAEVEVMVFRIAQEAINNVIKHAHATQVDICMNYRDDDTLLVIEDDGCGFDPAVVNSNGGKQKHFGLLSMKERADLIKGELEICSEPGQSACIRLRVPN